MPRPRDLSATERVYDAIVSFIAENNVSPTQQEIAAIVGRSRTAVCKQLAHLTNTGRIKLVVGNGKRRNISVVK